MVPATMNRVSGVVVGTYLASSLNLIQVNDL